MDGEGISKMVTKDSFGTRSILDFGRGAIAFYRLEKLAEDGVADVARLPYSLKVLLEAILRNENGREITADDVLNVARYAPGRSTNVVVPFKPARVLMQDFTGVPALVDLAALRSAMARFGRDPKRVNPQVPVDLIVDHSVQMDVSGQQDAAEVNARLEFERNRERFEFLRWGQKAFQNLSIVPPANGICHQVNLEYLGKVVQLCTENGMSVAYPDSLVGTDSHTPMINALGVLAWGVGGIEAEAVVLGQPYYRLMPDVLGVRLAGQLPEGTNATDLVLAITQLMRKRGVVGKIAEYFGPGVSALSLPDRATVSNMSPEMGLLTGFFPVDDETLNYLRYTGRTREQVELVENYCKKQGLFRADDSPVPEYQEVLDLDLSTIEPCLAGPKRPQDRVLLKDMKAQFVRDLHAPLEQRGYNLSGAQCDADVRIAYPDGMSGTLTHGDVVIAAITSCTNTSNPWVLLGAGLLAKKAVEAGLSVKPYVKTSLAPGSKVVTDYLEKSGLLPYLEALGFYVAGYGCATCIGNSGPLPAYVAGAIDEGNLVVASVLSGNRNFEGRINPRTRANYLASPMLVVAYALAGTVNIDLTVEPLGESRDGTSVYLKDIWPTSAEILGYLRTARRPEAYLEAYDGIETANEDWNGLPVTGEPVYDWRSDSTYIQEPPFFVDLSVSTQPITPIEEARVLVKVGNSVTTDHISPAGAIPLDSPAGQYLIGLGVAPEDFNSFGSRRGNDRVMVRGTFANLRLRNQLAPGTEGGWTTHFPTGDVTSVYDAALRYRREHVPTIVLAGADYGMGSSRDWAAKGTQLLGVRAVLAESFETIHRSNLVGMGVLPLQFRPGETASTLGLAGQERFTIHVDDHLTPRQEIKVEVIAEDGSRRTISMICRIDVPVEIEYYRHGGILPLVLRNMLDAQVRSELVP